MEWQNVIVFSAIMTGGFVFLVLVIGLGIWFAFHRHQHEWVKPHQGHFTHDFTEESDHYSTEGCVFHVRLYGCESCDKRKAVVTKQSRTMFNFTQWKSKPCITSRVEDWVLNGEVGG